MASDGFRYEVEDLPCAQEHPLGQYPSGRNVLDFTKVTVHIKGKLNLAENHEAHPDEKSFQDLFHFSSAVLPASDRCGVELGLRHNRWVLGVNYGLRTHGYKEYKLGGTVKDDCFYDVLFVKTSQSITIHINCEDNNDSTQVDLLEDIPTSALDNVICVGMRRDDTDFDWQGSIIHFVLTTGGSIY